MRMLLFFVVMFSPFNGLFSSYVHPLDACQESIREVSNGKIYLEPHRVWHFETSTFILNDSQQWISLGEVKLLQDSAGIYLEEKQQDWNNRHVCPREHWGVYYSKEYRIWFCRGYVNGEPCPYHDGVNFPNGH